MGYEYTEPAVLCQEYTVNSTSVGNFLIGALPKGIIRAIDVEVVTAFSVGTLKLGSSSGGAQIATTTEVDVTVTGMKAAATWRSTLPALQRTAQQNLFGGQAGGTPAAGGLVKVFVYYVPAELF